jgi:hypothetical protein
MQTVSTMDRTSSYPRALEAVAFFPRCSFSSCCVVTVTIESACIIVTVTGRCQGLRFLVAFLVLAGAGAGAGEDCLSRASSFLSRSISFCCCAFSAFSDVDNSALRCIFSRYFACLSAFVIALPVGFGPGFVIVSNPVT